MAPKTAKSDSKKPAQAAKKADNKPGKKEKPGKPVSGKKAKAKPAAKAGAKPAAKKPTDGKPVKRNKKPEALFVARPKNFGIGQDIRPKRDLTRFVRWPGYVKRQRQKSVLMRRLKIPPGINQFSNTLDRVTKKQLFKLAGKYKPETKKLRKMRLVKIAQKKANDPKAPHQHKRLSTRSGLQVVTRMIETKKAKLVLIANNVEPLELVIWLPTLCKKMEVPYCIVKGKAALGRLSNVKTTTCIAFQDVKSEDKTTFNKLVESIKIKFGDKYEEANKHWGGMKLGKKHDVKMAKREKMLREA
jgi:large subunit ribosomal protein L7Ae